MLVPGPARDPTASAPRRTRQETRALFADFRVGVRQANEFLQILVLALLSLKLFLLSLDLALLLLKLFLLPAGSVSPPQPPLGTRLKLRVAPADSFGPPKGPDELRVSTIRQG